MRSNLVSPAPNVWGKDDALVKYKFVSLVLMLYRTFYVT